MTFLAFLFGLALGALIVLIVTLYLGWSTQSAESPSAPDIPGFMQDAMEQMDEISHAYLGRVHDDLFNRGDKPNE